MPFLTINHKTIYRYSRLVARRVHDVFAGADAEARYEVQRAEKI